MAQQQPPHTGIAVVTVLSAFGVIITALITGHPMPVWLPPLLTGSIGTVLGFYFGTSAGLTPLSIAHSTIAHLAGLINGRHAADAAVPAPPSAPESKE